MTDPTTICLFCPTGKTFTFREAVSMKKYYVLEGWLHDTPFKGSIELVRAAEVEAWLAEYEWLKKGWQCGWLTYKDAWSSSDDLEQWIDSKPQSLE